MSGSADSFNDKGNSNEEIGSGRAKVKTASIVSVNFAAYPGSWNRVVVHQVKGLLSPDSLSANTLTPTTPTFERFVAPSRTTLTPARFEGLHRKERDERPRSEVRIEIHVRARTCVLDPCVTPAG